MEALYIKISKFSIGSLFFDRYLFFDVEPYLADQLFIRRRIRVWFDREYEKDGSPYVAILCRVRKRDSAAFLAALEDLQKKMLLCGHPDYEERVGAIIKEMHGRERNAS